MKRWNNVEELRHEREQLSEKFDGGLPKYLVDFFDAEEEKFLRQDYYRNKAIRKNKTPIEERRKIVKEGQERFWSENRFKIVKKPKRVGKHLEPVFKEAPINDDIVEKEESITEEERKILVAACETSIYSFAVRYFSHYLKYPSSKLHKYLYSFLERNLNKPNRRKGFKHAIAAPRGNAKSSLISCIFPLWCIAYNKKKFIVIVSDTASQSEDFLEEIKRELDANELLKRDFPHIVGKGPTWRQDEVITANNIKVMALGTLSKVRGRRFGTTRPDLIIGDDLENSDLIRSPTSRDFLRNQWFNKDLLYCGDRHTDFFIVGTIIGNESLLNALVNPEEYPDWTSRVFKAVEEFSDSPLWEEWARLARNHFDINRVQTARKFFLNNRKEMLEGVKVLWPEGDPYYGLMVYKLSDPSGFQSEKQNNPLDPTKILMPESDLAFRNFKSDPEIQRILKDRASPYFGSLDPSLGKKSTSDYSAIMTLKRDRRSGVLLVVDINIKRRNIDAQIEAILKLYEKYQYRKFGIEVNGFQIALKENLIKESKKEKVYIPVEELRNYSDKHMRMQGLAPLVTDGTIIFDSDKRRYNQQYAIGLEQIYTYCEGAAHDDAPDALEMAVRLCRKKRFKLQTKSNT